MFNQCRESAAVGVVAAAARLVGARARLSSPRPPWRMSAREGPKAARLGARGAVARLRPQIRGADPAAHMPAVTHGRPARAQQEAQM